MHCTTAALDQCSCQILALLSLHFYKIRQKKLAGRESVCIRSLVESKRSDEPCLLHVNAGKKASSDNLNSSEKSLIQKHADEDFRRFVHGSVLRPLSYSHVMVDTL